MSQSRMQSALESLTNVAAGYLVALGVQGIVFPLFGIHVTLIQNIGIAAVFTGVSLVRSYMIRRWFNGVA